MIERPGAGGHGNSVIVHPGSVIPGRHRKVASPESITLGQWLWIVVMDFGFAPEVGPARLQHQRWSKSATADFDRARPGMTL